MKFLLIYPTWEKLDRQTRFTLPPHGPVVMAAALPVIVNGVQGRLTDSISQLEQMRREFADTPRLLIDLGLSYRDSKQLESAAQTLRRCLRPGEGR